MKDFRNTVLATADHQLAGLYPYAWLLAVRIPSDPVQWFRVTSFSSAIERGTDTDGHPIVFYPFPVAIGDFESQTKANLSDVTISVANCTLELSRILDSYDGLSDQPVIIRLVHTQGLADPNAEDRYDGTVISCRVSDQVASFTVSAKTLTQAFFPKNRLNALDCINRFGDDNCGYTIPASPGETIGTGFSTCGRELADCEIRGLDEAARGVTVLHPKRFGACPGLRGGVR